jgi:Zn-dependent protease with chaperone function
VRSPFRTTAYRTPDELFILGLTLLLVFAVIILSAVATFCASFILVALGVFLAYSSSKAHHQVLMERAYPVSDTSAPELAALVRQCVQRLQPGVVQVFVTPSNQLNAYTFGLSDPRIVVLYSALFDVMDADELRFVFGHELGHVQLGHTRLNTLLGGMAGIPSSSAASALLVMAFLSWNRACEYSADRAGLLVCGKPEKAITALVKLVAGPKGLTRRGLELAYRQIDAEDDTWIGNLNEALASHPLLIRRINQIRSYAATQEYKSLQAMINQNSAAAM